MNVFVRRLFGLVLAAGVTSLLLAGLALEGAPRVERRGDVSAADIDRAVTLLRQHDPRRALPGQVRRVTLEQRDLDLLVDHAAQRGFGGAARVRLQPGRGVVEASLAAPLARWINIELGLRQTDALPQVDGLRIGRIALPSALALPLLRAVAERHGVQADALLAAGAIERVGFAPGQMLVSYRSDAMTTQRLRAALTSPADQQRLRAYHDRLVGLSMALPGPGVSVARWLAPMFALAAERSAAGGDASAENRAALLALTFYANRRPLGLLVPAAHGWPQPRALALTLQDRPDFALHFLVSAVLAAESGTPLADAVGLWKELADARPGGSGFSFADLAADRAGTRFGEAALRDPQRLQARIAAAAGAREADFMPATADLPEFLPEAEFVKRYGGVGAVPYNRMLAEIEARITGLSLYR